MRHVKVAMFICYVVKETKPAQQEDKEDKEELEALPNKLADYDSNADGLLYYEEFAHAIMSANNMTDPSELRGLFNLCDENGEYI